MEESNKESKERQRKVKEKRKLMLHKGYTSYLKRKFLEDLVTQSS